MIIQKIKSKVCFLIIFKLKWHKYFIFVLNRIKLQRNNKNIKNKNKIS